MQTRNYQKELDKLIEKLQAEGIRPKLLIHSCCAPCSSYVMEYLSKYFDLTMYFYNPNMDSREEYEYRARELQRLVAELNKKAENASGPDEITPIKVVIADFDPETFEAMAVGHENDPERGARCMKCYELRLRRTAEYMVQQNANAAVTGDSEAAAGEMLQAAGFDYFATTLTLSPLKNAEALNTIGEQLAEQYNIKCLATDFKKRNGYKRSIELSKEYDLYRQNYCGCRFSKNYADEEAGLIQ